MRTLLILLVSLASACDCGDDEGAGPATPCEGDAPDPLCGTACLGDGDCGPDLYCGAEGCTADCGPAGGCVGGDVCSDHGRCLTVDGGQGSDTDGGGNGCPGVSVVLERVIPTVVLLIDQSGSMDQDFGRGDRWEGVHDALVDPDQGVVSLLQSEVRFGATLYTSDDGGPGCPILTAVAPALDNYDPIRDLIESHGPSGDTPTGESIHGVMQALLANPDPDGGPTLIVLATDGEPDTCTVPDPQNGQPEAIAAAQAAFANGIPVKILSVGNEVGAPHLQDMANAGAGAPVGGGQNETYYTADDPDELAAAFEEIIGGVRSCTFTLGGAVDLADAPGGEVVLNGQTLGYQDANGWQLVDPSTLELLGTACTTMLENPEVSLSATFPCGSVIF